MNPLASDEVCGAVLCAGLGTRLRPATLHTPKPGVPFLGRPIAVHSLEAMVAAGITRLGVNTHHLPEAMLEALRPFSTKHPLCVSHEDGEIQGTGGGLREIWRQLGPDKPIVMAHGDVVLGVDLAPIIAAHQASRAAATLVLKLRDGSTSLRGVFTDASGQVARILTHERPARVEPLFEHAFTGIQVLSPEVFGQLPKSGPCCLVNEIYPKLLAADRPLHAFLTTAFYADLGTYPRYLEAQSAVFEGPARLGGVHWPTQREPGLYLDESVHLEAGAKLISPVRLEGAVTVRRGATVGPYAALQGEIEVCAGCTVERASVWGKGVLVESIKNRLEALGPEVAP